MPNLDYIHENYKQKLIQDDSQLTGDPLIEG